MPKNTQKDTTNGKTSVVAVDVHELVARGDERGRVKPEHELTADEQIAVRTDPSAVTALDGKYRKVFVVANKHGEVDWSDPSLDGWHAANKTQTMQQALLHGVHPKGEAVFEGVRETTHDGNDVLVYAVEGVPAGLDETPEDLTLVAERPADEAQLA